MTLMACPECQGQVSDRAPACPHCGYLIAAGQKPGGWPGVLGGVTGTFLSTQAVVTIVVGSVMFICFAAIMIAAILR